MQIPSDYHENTLCKIKLDILLIANPGDPSAQQLMTFLGEIGYRVETEHFLGAAIQKAQIKQFDVIILDAHVRGLKIERLIQIFKGLNHKVKIIVKTTSNSKNLEVRIRKEGVYYYHIDMFGIDELQMAVASALNECCKNLRTGEEERTMSNNTKILIVDDDPDFVEINKVALEKKGYQINIAYDPDEGWQKVENWHPDLIILDVMMPTSTEGFHFAYKLRNAEKYRTIPILMITQVNEKKNFRFSDSDGSFLPVNEFVEKPVSAKDLVNHVESLLAQKLSRNAWEKTDVYKGMGLKSPSE